MADVTDQEKDNIFKMLQGSEQLEARQASMAAACQAEAGCTSAFAWSTNLFIMVLRMLLMSVCSDPVPSQN